MKKQKELARMLSVVNELNAQLTAQLADRDAEVKRLRKQQYTYLSNLTWLLERFKGVLGGSPVRDADEIILTVEQLLSTTQQEEG
jgi:hypothetical protein